MKERNHLAQKVAELEHRNELQRRGSARGSHAGDSPKAQDSPDMKSMFYQPEDPKASPLKPPRPLSRNKPNIQSSPDKSDQELNPFSFSSKQEQKSIPDILSMFAKVDFRSTFGKKQMKLNVIYNIMTGELGFNLSVVDLKSLNRFLQSR